jgi:hypothetical protein
MRGWVSKEILGRGLACSTFALLFGIRPAFLWLFRDLMSRAFLCGGRSLMVGHLFACLLAIFPSRFFRPLSFILVDDEGWLRYHTRLTICFAVWLWVARPINPISGNTRESDLLMERSLN